MPPAPGPHRFPLVVPDRRRGGFALLITITLLAFLVLLLVSLASLTRVETQVVGNNQRLAQARQNALLALNLAIGALQKTTGPDQRVTATADLQPLSSGATTDPASGVSLSAAGATASSRMTATKNALDQIDTYWRGSRNRRWTGVWQNTNASAFNADSPSSSNAQLNTTPVWLVSGNETTPATYKPTDVVIGLTAASTPLDDIKDSQNRSHRLLVKTSAGVTDAASLDRAVTAPAVAIDATNIPGTGGASTTIGHYAWWVGDEGVKARANLVDAYATDTSAAAQLTRSQSAQRPAVEAMTSDGTDGLAPLDPALRTTPAALDQFDSNLLKTFTRAQLAYVTSDASLPAELKTRFHDLSVLSRSVLSDARHGGLKHDLTYLLSRPDLNSFRTALNTALPGFAPASDYNRLLSTTATPYATQPPLLLSASGAFSGNNVYQTMDMFQYGATWEQLWSYFNMGNNVGGTPAGVFTASGDARPRLQSGVQQGLYPLVEQVKLFYKLRIPGGTLDSDGVDRTDNIWMDIIPVIVLANPYNVALEAQNYILTSAAGASGRVRLYYGITPADPESATLSLTPTGVNELAMNDNGLGSVRITIKAPRMEAGRAYVFTLENASTTIPATATAQKALAVNMVNDFNPANVLTFDTTKKIAPGFKYAALTTDNGIIAFRLFSSDFTDALGDQTLIRYLLPHTYVADSANNTVLVYPLSSGLRHGGGMALFIHDASNVATCQQAPAYQLNYRALIVDNAAYTSFGTNPNGTGQKDISISWARTRVKSGATSLPNNDTPNQFIESNLLWRDASDPTQVRWGIYNTGDGYDGTVIPSALSGETGLVNILYDVPRADHPPASIAQLRHFNIGGYIPRADFSKPSFADSFASKNHSFQPNYPVGDSYPNPFIIRQKVIDGDGGMGFQYDGSFLLNDVLQDRFFFSTFPSSGPFDFAAGKLVNNRDRPFRPQSSVAWNDPANFRTDSRSAATNLLVDGAFNINSTSVDAWKAVLSGLKNVPVGGETSAANLTAPFARTLYQPGGAAGSRDGNTVNAWTGTINLTATEVDSLAREIVLQIRRRGPFVSMADFLNRRLVASASDTLGLGLSGALQSAIDRIFNQTTDVQPSSLQASSNSRPSNTRLAENAFIMPTGISGFSGYILQSDLLSTLGPGLSARSDTFTIRTYGDSVNPATGRIEGQAWCEAVVQRTPDYVVPKDSGGNSPDETPAAGSTNDIYGRRYQIVSFRWLSPSDI